MYRDKMKYFLFSAVTALIVFFAVLAGYILISVGSRSVRLYRLIKSPEGRGWEGIVHEADPMLGFKPIPMSEGVEFLSDGKTGLRVIFDENSCRIPRKDYAKDQAETRNSPIFLFLGCSFTYGSACRSEDTFPFLLAEYAGGTAVNAGVISYGFPQMIIRAKELIPKIKPSFVVVQVSPWLILRGTNMYRPTRYGKVPVPYFSKVNGQYSIVPPVYKTNIFDVPIRQFMDTKVSAKDMLSFFIKVGVPFYVYSDIQDSYVRFRKLTGMVPYPADFNREGAAIERYVYGEIGALCEQNNAVLVLMSIIFNENITYDLDKEWNSNFIHVNADEALLKEASGRSENYDIIFKHVSGEPAVIIDSHPNPRAHRVIAEKLYYDIKEWAKGFKRKREDASGT